MHLTLFTDYAVRVLILLGISGDRLVTIEETARRYGVSSNHMMKVVNRLSRTGFIQTVRGKKGGMRLATAPERIRLGQVVRELEQGMAAPGCVHGVATGCALEPCCSMRGALERAFSAFLATLDEYTLADLIGSPRQLCDLLDLHIDAAEVRQYAET